MMRGKNKWLMLAGILPVLALGMILIWACGSYKGPGSGNTGNTGFILTIVSITPQDAKKDTFDIDVVQENCAAGGTAEPKPETFTDATMKIDIRYELTESCQTTTCPNLHLTSYDVEYSSTADGSAAIASLTNVTISQWLQPGDDVTLDGLILLPIDRKWEFCVPPCDPSSPSPGDPWEEPLYRVKIKMRGITDTGEDVSVEGSTYILLLDWDNC